MTPAQSERIEQRLNSQARKVLAAVPFETAWSLGQITNELRRQGQNVDRVVLDGCLATLKAEGLIREPTVKHYIRVQLRMRIVSNESTPMTTSDPVRAPEPGRARLSITDRFINLAASLRLAAKEIDDLVLELHDEHEANEAKLAKVHQLQTLLKDIGSGG